MGDNIIIDLSEIEWKNMEWIYLAPDRTSGKLL
jgi:hypothetical protein